MTGLTLSEAATSLHTALRDYIEATYHVSDQTLVDQRRQLLEQMGVINQEPYIESTPRYRTGERLRDLGLPVAATEALTAATQARHDGRPLIHDPLFEHQIASLNAVLREGRSAIITTGTGSGKTESFLLPILGRLAEQANQGPTFFEPASLRAIVLYPMNALVNDQLGRMRVLFGHEVVSDWFTRVGGRPLRFARYTSRTLYPGVRTSKRDQQRLRPLGKYYVSTARSAGDASASNHARDATLLEELKRRGKWPAKPDIIRWFGPEGSRWQGSTGEFLRCLTLPNDPELLTRHEVLANPPDILVTNYSMLEYMLMRPLERPIFDATAEWFAANDESITVVIDEAHLYRGASGSEVALLMRRLRDRLGLPANRLQVICTTASFGDASKAAHFAAALTGKQPDDFVSIGGTLATLPDAAAGSRPDAEMLASIDLDGFYQAEGKGKHAAVSTLLDERGATQTDVSAALYEALSAFPPMKLLVNTTMTQARPVSEMGALLFPDAPAAIASKAATALVALGSYAREPGMEDGPGLLPSRVHAFFRGLPGLWVCVDPECSELPERLRGGPAGRLYAQPTERCACGARVFELFTCRECGSAYCRAYAESVDSPTFLWATGGEALASATDTLRELEPLDLLLQEPVAVDAARPAELDLNTGRLDPQDSGKRSRLVFLPPTDASADARNGEFKPCGVCGRAGTFGRSSVQDHVTKGDEPFQALITRQVEIQAPVEQPTKFAPMGGRKVLVFSDSRQTAARLAPNLQRYTTRDAVRPLLVAGYAELAADPDVGQLVSLEECYLSVLLTMERLGVRLRPATRIGDTFEPDVSTIRGFVERGEPAAEKVQLLVDFRSRNASEAVLDAIHEVINHTYYGLRPLALASIEPKKFPNLAELPPLDGANDDAAKQSVVSAWINEWRGQWLRSTPQTWIDDKVRPRSGKFQAMFKRILETTAARRTFERDWLPVLLAEYADPVGAQYRLKGSALTLQIGGAWGYCGTCRGTQRPLSWGSKRCARCGRDTLQIVDPDVDAVFVARKGYYRRSTVLALREKRQPIALVAAEHTAQLNEAQADAVFSEAEENELLFQDVDLGDGKPAIDVLSCTTTMEVGIDIGSLAGVALRNMPPARANYQQRAGRSGRRGRAVATVVAFAGAQSHDEYGFSTPDELIRGPVIDPEMSLDNWQIARRHIAAFVLQEYLRDRVLAPTTQVGGSQRVQLFEVLGSVEDFTSGEGPVSRLDYRVWLDENIERLTARATRWLPEQLPGSRDQQVAAAIRGTAEAIDRAVGWRAEPSGSNVSSDGEADEPQPEFPAEEGDPAGRGVLPQETLLGRLLYRGVLPRYAFPTDVATFHVFDPGSDARFRPAFLYTPGQGMAAALSQYAPGKRVWIGGREWVSGAIYSRMQSDRSDAWAARRAYRECGVCRYAETAERGSAAEDRSCPACGAIEEFSDEQTWLIPPGFAHPIYLQENTSPDDEPPPSYATRARLTAPSPLDPEDWTAVNERIGIHFGRMHLLVTNRGPRNEGYTYCTLCGRIEPAVTAHTGIVPGHQKPYPDRDPVCIGNRTARGVVLGTDFVTDVLLVGLSVDSPLTLRAEYASTRMALRTISEALVTQATRLLGIGEGEIQAEFRPATSAEGRSGHKAEIYMYDTLPGGAGYSQRVGQLGRALFQDTLDLLTSCPSNCESSCYRCLRNYKNQFDHGFLDRHLGASLLRYLLTSATPVVDERRVEASTSLLFTDLQSHGLPDLKLSRNAVLDVPGFGQMSAPIHAARANGVSFVVGLRHPFAPSVALHNDWTGPAEFGIDPAVLLVDELAIRRNLPRASAEVLRRLGYSA